MSEEKNKKTVPDRKAVIAKISGVLKERRKSQHLDFKSISATLKIRVPFLEAMEQGKWDELPGEVYLKGFLTKYAQYLGVDGPALIKPYLELSDQPQPQEPQAIEDEADTDGFRMSWIWTSLGVLLFVGLVKFFMPSSSPSSPTEDFSIPNAPAPSAPEQPFQSVQDQAVAKNLVPHTIGVFTPEVLWLRVVAEDKTFEGFIPEKTTWSWTGEGQFQVRLGHTRGVHIQFDGDSVALTENQKRIQLPYDN